MGPFAKRPTGALCYNMPRRLPYEALSRKALKRWMATLDSYVGASGGGTERHRASSSTGFENRIGNLSLKLEGFSEVLQLDRYWQKALAGMAGALANEILRLYLVGTGQSPGHLIPSVWWQYLLVTIAYLVLAGVVTILWDDPNPIKCFAIGVGLPRIIQSIAQTGVQIPKTNP